MNSCGEDDDGRSRSGDEKGDWGRVLLIVLLLLSLLNEDDRLRDDG